MRIVQASIEAEKNKPRKEVKSKVTTTIPVIATQEKKQNGGGQQQQQENQHDGQGQAFVLFDSFFIYALYFMRFWLE